MNSEKIFEIALGLQSPWYIKAVKFENETGKHVLNLELDYREGYFVDEGGRSTVYDRQERSWRHLNFFQHECYIHCRVPRIREKGSGKIRQVEVPWARAGSGFTLLFEAFAMCLIEQEMPINKAGRLVGEYPNRLWTIFNYWIGIAYTEAEHEGVEVLGIDETSSKKGHDYVTIAVDMDKSCVVHATEGKDAGTITQIAEYLESKGTKKEQIKKVCIDLSPAFISGVSKEFEQAQIIFDRYHVKALLNNAMDEVRKRELRLHQELKGHKYLFLKSNKKLSARQKQERNELLELLPNIGEAYRLKVLFDDFWQLHDKEDAAGFLAYWCDLVTDSKIQPLMKFASTVKVHWTGILNYTENKISNGILEGINSKIQLAKRRARGFRNLQNFINTIYFIAGKLHFNYPHFLA